MRAAGRGAREGRAAAAASAASVVVVTPRPTAAALWACASVPRPALSSRCATAGGLGGTQARYPALWKRQCLVTMPALPPFGLGAGCAL